jgi:hypothetical protein
MKFEIGQDKGIPNRGFYVKVAGSIGRYLRKDSTVGLGTGYSHMPAEKNGWFPTRQEAQLAIDTHEIRVMGKIMDVMRGCGIDVRSPAQIMQWFEKHCNRNTCRFDGVGNF